MLRRRILLAAIVLAFGSAGIAVAASLPDRADERETSTSPEPTDPATPAAAPSTPEPPEEADRTATHRAPDRKSTTERHVIHGSGSIAVVSGQVEEGDNASGTRLRYVGPSPRPPRKP